MHRKPTKCKENNDSYQHFEESLLPLLFRHVTRTVSTTGGNPKPGLVDYSGVEHRNDSERNNVEEDKQGHSVVPRGADLVKERRPLLVADIHTVVLYEVQCVKQGTHGYEGHQPHTQHHILYRVDGDLTLCVGQCYSYKPKIECERNNG